MCFPGLNYIYLNITSYQLTVDLLILSYKKRKLFDLDFKSTLIAGLKERNLNSDVILRQYKVEV